MSAMQRTKGQSGECEIAAIVCELTGWDVRRRVRQHAADADREGIPGWTPEVKRHRAAGRAEIASWWRQTVAPATHGRPVLSIRLDRADWCAAWPVAVFLEQDADEVMFLWVVGDFKDQGRKHIGCSVAKNRQSAQCAFGLDFVGDHQHSCESAESIEPKTVALKKGI